MKTSKDLRQRLRDLRATMASALREIEGRSTSRELSAEMRLQLKEAVEHFACGGYLLTPLPGHRVYARRAA